MKISIDIKNKLDLSFKKNNFEILFIVFRNGICRPPRSHVYTARDLSTIPTSRKNSHQKHPINMTAEQEQITGRVVAKNVVEFDIRDAKALDWNEYSLAVGYGLGVAILGPMDNKTKSWNLQKSYEYLGKQVLRLRFKGDQIVTTHPDFTLSVLTLSEDPSQPNSVERLGTDSSRGHHAWINDVDCSPQGHVASTGSDKRLILWANGSFESFMLKSTGLAVKFWEDNESDRLLILETGGKVRVFDWRKSQWLVTIFVNAPVRGLGLYDGDVVAVGLGWWKSYHLPSLRGGCGYTYPYDDGSHVGGESSDLIAYSSSRYVAYGGPSGVTFFDIANAGEHGVKTELDLNVPPTAVALRPQGDLCALTTAASLFIFER